MTSKICGRDVCGALRQTGSTRGTEAAPAKDFTDAVIMVQMSLIFLSSEPGAAL